MQNGLRPLEDFSEQIVPPSAYVVFPNWKSTIGELFPGYSPLLFSMRPFPLLLRLVVTIANRLDWAGVEGIFKNNAGASNHSTTRMLARHAIGIVSAVFSLRSVVYGKVANRCRR